MLIASLFPYQWLHPGGSGYWFYSGIFGGSAFLSAAAGAIFLAKHKFNCHVKHCPRLGHPDPEHGWPACRKHHSQKDKLR